MNWLVENAPWLVPTAAVVAGLAWKKGTAYLAKQAAAKFSGLVDKAIELGDDEWDAITIAAVRKLEKEIPDGITAEHPKVKAFAAELCSGEGYFGLLKGQEAHIAEAIAAIAASIDSRAKQRGHGKKQKKEGEAK